MSDQAKLRAALDRARTMKAFAEGEGGFFELLDILEAEWLAQWRKTAPEAVQAREAIHARCAALKGIRRVLHAVISDGKPAEAEIERLRRVEAGEERPYH